MAELKAVSLPSAGQRTSRRPVPRWLLLAFTLLGLAAMHTIGHTGAGHAMAVPQRPAHLPHTAAMTLTGHSMSVAAPMPRACPDCTQLGSGGTAGGHPSTWSVCLAILAALAVVVLAGWLMRTAAVSGGVFRSIRPVAVAPRGPPLPGLGLRLADLSVLRR